jgi:hypothetical protein
MVAFSEKCAKKNSGRLLFSDAYPQVLAKVGGRGVLLLPIKQQTVSPVVFVQ